jgi:hypothetical protein
MATNKHIQSVLAKAITDVGYLRHLEQSRDGNAALIGDLSHGAFQEDLERITRFSAFIAKVQHNFLWGDFRISFSLLHAYGLEIAVFTAYLPFHQENKKNAPLTNAVKTDRFITFLKAYLSSQKGQPYKMISYAVEHEDSIRKLKENVKKVATRYIRPKAISPGSIVKINGCFHIHGFTIKPEEVTASRLQDKKVRLSRKRGRYVYWIDGQKKDLQIITITKEVEKVLHCIDGSNSIENIVKKAGSAFGADTTLDVLDLLLRYKVIYLK